MIRTSLYITVMAMNVAAQKDIYSIIYNLEIVDSNHIPFFHIILTPKKKTFHRRNYWVYGMAWTALGDGFIKLNICIWLKLKVVVHLQSVLWFKIANDMRFNKTQIELDTVLLYCCFVGQG